MQAFKQLETLLQTFLTENDVPDNDTVTIEAPHPIIDTVTALGIVNSNKETLLLSNVVVSTFSTREDPDVNIPLAFRWTLDCGIVLQFMSGDNDRTALKAIGCSPVYVPRIPDPEWVRFMEERAWSVFHDILRNTLARVNVQRLTIDRTGIGYIFDIPESLRWLISMTISPNELVFTDLGWKLL